MSTPVALSGGGFQDVTGNPLSLGFLLLQLSQDAQANGNENVCAGSKIKITLDGSGNVATGQSVWPNDVLTPSGTFYTVAAYAADGQLVWGPNAVMVFSTPSPFNVGAWAPDAVSTSSTQITNYDIGLFVPAQYTANQVLLLIPLERTVYFSQNLTPSVASAGTHPTAQAVWSLNKNGSQFGTLTINTNGTTSFSSSSLTTFNAGDVLTVIGASVNDATLANVGLILSGTTSFPTGG